MAEFLLSTFTFLIMPRFFQSPSVDQQDMSCRVEAEILYLANVFARQFITNFKNGGQQFIKPGNSTYLRNVMH